MLVRPSHRTSAASLIELLTVTAILAVLAGFAIGGLRGAKQRAQITQARGDLAALANALENYKRHYGDYPQLGEFTNHATIPASTTSPAAMTAEVKLFNCLTGVFGPRSFAERISGPNFLEGTRFLDANAQTLRGTLANTFLVPTANADRPPSRTEQNVCLVDPWGQPYFYYYKNARSPAAWQASGYLLFSVGPDGAHTAPPPNGVMTPTQLSAANNADNIYANR